MATRTRKTTGPGVATTAQSGATVSCPTLVIVWSAAEPHRVGESAPIPFGETLYIGRGDGDGNDEKFAHFVRQRPGEVGAVDPREELLAGDSLSKWQLQVRSVGDALVVDRMGRCATFINGDTELKTTAELRPGDTVLFKGELLLLCVLRPRAIARPECLGSLHAFGERDAHGIAGESPAAWAMRAELATAAATNDHVLIRGETGTGKELAAAQLHRLSARAHRIYLSCNASAIPPTLVAAELFGNQKGFPNPEMDERSGLVGAADGGTLFLDEIGDLPFAAQAQLLRFLELGEYRTLGQSKWRYADVRVLGATNQDDSHFREDFVARFTVQVWLPPLRVRREDIPILVRHFLLQRAQGDKGLRKWLLKEMPDGRLEPKVSAHLIDHLVRHALPRNVRELRTILVRAIGARTGDKLTVPPPESHAPSLLPRPTVGPLAGGVKAGTPAKEEVEACLRSSGGNVARAARVLGISRGAIYRLMEKLGIELDEKE